jgi:hypothetical protein
MQITATKTGIGPLGVIGVALGAGLPAAAIAALALLRQPAAAEKPTVQPPAAAVPADHWDAVTEELQADGSWKLVRREHLK